MLSWKCGAQSVSVFSYQNEITFSPLAMLFCHLPTMASWSVFLNCNASPYQYPQLAVGLAATHPNLAISDADVLLLFLESLSATL